jgi:hypothetical protein
MTDNHPITPPPELVRQWATQRDAADEEAFWQMLATRAARWGALQELKACCEYIERAYSDPSSTGDHALVHRGILAKRLRAERRPKPPSMKEQALKELEFLADIASRLGCSGSAIRRALEALPAENSTDD